MAMRKHFPCRASIAWALHKSSLDPHLASPAGCGRGTGSQNATVLLPLPHPAGEGWGEGPSEYAILCKASRKRASDRPTGREPSSHQSCPPRACIMQRRILQGLCDAMRSAGTARQNALGDRVPSPSPASGHQASSPALPRERMEVRVPNFVSLAGRTLGGRSRVLSSLGATSRLPRVYGTAAVAAALGEGTEVRGLLEPVDRMSHEALGQSTTLRVAVRFCDRRRRLAIGLAQHHSRCRQQRAGHSLRHPAAVRRRLRERQRRLRQSPGVHRQARRAAAISTSATATARCAT